MNTPENTTDGKGRVKEAVGNITGDEGLKEEGRIDQATGKVKHLVDEAAEKFKHLRDRH